MAISSLTGLTLAACVRLELTARESFLPTTLIAMILLYLASLADALQPAFILLMILGLSSFFLFAASKWRSEIKRVSDIRVFLVLILCFWGLTSLWLRDFRFIGYDEFTHWALVAKFLIERDSLPVAGSYISFMQYAPGTALIQYFFASFAHGAEQAILFGHLCLFFASLVFLTNQSQNHTTTAAIIVWSVLATYVLRYDLSFIFVDAMLGALLAAAFMCVMMTADDCSRGLSPRALFLLIPIVSYLPLVKHVGLVLSLSAIAFLAVTTILLNYQRQHRQPWFLMNVGLSNSLVLLLALFASYMSWKLHYQSLGIPDSYRAVITIKNAVEFFFGPSDPTHIAVWQTFAKRMTSSVGIVTAVLLAWSAAIVFLSSKEKRWLLAVSFCAILLGFIGYLSLLLVSYAFFFQGDERIHLASFERYARSYQLAWLFFLIALPTTSKFWTKQPKRIWSALALLAGCAGLVTHPLAQSSLFERAHIHGADREKRAAIENLARQVKSAVEPQNSLYFFDILGDGLSWYMLRFELAGGQPINTCWSAPARLVDGSLGPPNANCETDLTQVIAEHDYVVLFSLDAKTKGINAGLFRDELVRVPGLYRVNRTTDGQLWLSFVDNK